MQRSFRTTAASSQQGKGHITVWRRLHYSKSSRQNMVSLTDASFGFQDNLSLPTPIPPGCTGFFAGLQLSSCTLSRCHLSFSGLSQTKSITAADEWKRLQNKWLIKVNHNSSVNTKRVELQCVFGFQPSIMSKSYLCRQNAVPTYLCVWQ